MSHPQKRFQKLARTPQELVTHLLAKGLTIPSHTVAQNAISRIGYYRLLIYMRPLQHPATKQFQAHATFDDILSLYNFDRELRLLCMDAIEKIEVSLRAAIVNPLAVNLGAHFHVRSRHFDKPEGFKEFMEATSKLRKSLAVEHYYNNYNDPALPPIWVVLEGLTYGTLSRMYSNLHTKNRKLAAREFGYDEAVLVSWFRAINELRNRCAHHNRLVDVTMNANAPTAPRALRAEFASAVGNKFCKHAIVLVALLARIDHSSTWKTDLKALFAKYPTVPEASLGFPAAFQTRPFWL